MVKRHSYFVHKVFSYEVPNSWIWIAWRRMKSPTKAKCFVFQLHSKINIFYSHKPSCSISAHYNLVNTPNLLVLKRKLKFLWEKSKSNSYKNITQPSSYHVVSLWCIPNVPSFINFSDKSCDVKSALDIIGGAKSCKPKMKSFKAPKAKSCGGGGGGLLSKGFPSGAGGSGAVSSIFPSGYGFVVLTAVGSVMMVTWKSMKVWNKY